MKKAIGILCYPSVGGSGVVATELGIVTVTGQNIVEQLVPQQIGQHVVADMIVFGPENAVHSYASAPLGPSC